MITTSPAITIPIRTDEHGTIRIIGTRIPLETVVIRFQQGRTPEQIRDSFPTLKLPDIYAVITYYLNNQVDVDDYIQKQDEEADRVWREIEAKRPDIFELETTLRERIRNRSQG